MVHKRYVFKQGKKYGPYYYESYRTGNKIKKRYLGKSSDFSFGSLMNWTGIGVLFILLIVLALIGLIVRGTIFFNGGMTGRAIEETQNVNGASENGLESVASPEGSTGGEDFVSSSPDSSEGSSGGGQESADASEATPTGETSSEEELQTNEGNGSSGESESIPASSPSEGEGSGGNNESGDLKEVAPLPEPENESAQTEPAENISEVNETKSNETEILLPNETLTNETKLNETEILPPNQTQINETLFNETLLNETQINETLTNETILNETLFNESIINISGLRLIKPLSDILVRENGSAIIVLDDYFEGAIRYELVASNVSWGVANKIMELVPEKGFRGSVEARIIAYSENESLESNKFQVKVSNAGVIISTYREKIKVGEPVRWIKNITFYELGNISLELPAEVQNISVKQIDLAKKEDKEIEPELVGITGSVISFSPEKSFIYLFLEKIKELFSRVFKGITGFAIGGEIFANEGEVILTNVSIGEKSVFLILINATSSNYVIEYYTEGPTISEEEFDDWKLVSVFAPELNYKDVIVGVNISENLSLMGNALKVYWRNYDAARGSRPEPVKNVQNVEEIQLIEELEMYPGENGELVEEVSKIGVLDNSENELKNEERANNLTDNISSNESAYILQELPAQRYDLNNNSIVDYIEWVAPHLSNQTFEIRVANITKGLNFTICGANDYCLFIRNSSGANKAIFDKYGNLDLAGGIYVQSSEMPGEKGAFVIKNGFGNVSAWINATTGDLHLAGILIQQQGGECNPVGNSFIIRNSSGSCVLYINKTGSLWASGIVNEYAGI